MYSGASSGVSGRSSEAVDAGEGVANVGQNSMGDARIADSPAMKSIASEVACGVVSVGKLVGVGLLEWWSWW